MKKKFIWRLLPWLIILAALAALVVFVGIPLFTPEVPRDIPAPEVSYYEGDKTPLILENDALLFEMDPTTTHFKVTEKLPDGNGCPIPLMRIPIPLQKQPIRNC